MMALPQLYDDVHHIERVFVNVNSVSKELEMKYVKKRQKNPGKFNLWTIFLCIISQSGCNFEKIRRKWN